jgi:microcystin-dependent protein
MTTPFLGEVRMFAGNFAPQGWAFCNGQTLAITQNSALFTLIGTTYGGDGVTTFNLPNLGSRIPYGGDGTRPIGTSAGEESVTLTTQQIPAHSHPVGASDNAASQTSPAGNVPATWGDTPYSNGPSNTSMDSTGVASTGGNQPHENRPPFLALTFIIALEGIFPSQT